MKIPIQRHLFCRISRCAVCLLDCDALRDYLASKLGPHSPTDWLGEYRSWLDRAGIAAETEWGWGHPNFFKPVNIKAFCDYWKNHEVLV